MAVLMDKLLNQLLEKLQKAYGEGLVSVVLYGSAAAGDRQPKFSDYNVLCVLSEISPRELAAATDVFRWWREQGSPAPLLLSEQEMSTSSDCFPIEFTDIQQNHQILFGKDVVTNMVVERCFYRAQVEHELRAKLLRLRQKASGMLGDPDLVRRLLLDSVSTFCVLFRHALALGGAAAPGRKRDVIQEASQQFGFNPLPFEKLLDVREDRAKPGGLDPVPLLGEYLEGISKVIDAVDRLEK
jgi:hypothetical protein